MKLIRAILSVLILTWDRLFSPQEPNRSPEAQRAIDLQTRSLSLYQFEGCPFCVKVRRQIKRLGLKIELRDAQNNAQFESELLQGGGERQVPCLRIQKSDGQVEWMYESSVINEYLAKTFPVAHT